MNLEYRSFTAESVEATDEGHVFGLAIPYNRVTTIGNMDHGGFREQIAPGSCNKSMREADIVALNNHNSWQPLGRTSAGNLVLKSTSRGVEPDLTPIDTTYGNDLLKNVKGGIVRGWSFGFEVVKDDWTDDEGRESDEYTGTNRTIREMKLIEVSPVTFPAYDTTDIAARSGILADREERCARSRADDATAPESGSASRTRGSKRDARGGGAPGDGSKPYGDVPYADPGYLKDGKKRYPLDTKAHAQSAWAYISVATNADQYNSEQLASVKAKIKAACTKFGISINEKNEQQLAGEWREAIEARKAAKKAKREAKKTARRDKKAVREARSLHCVTCGGILRCLHCNPVQPIPKSGDPNVEGAEHGVNGAATASANSADPGGETRDDGKSDLSSGTAKRIPQINALLGQALKLFGGADLKSLPDDVQQAIALVSSASTHASHIQDHEGLEPADAISDNDAGRSADPKPGETTSESIPDDNALILARLRMISRDIDLGT